MRVFSIEKSKPCGSMGKPTLFARLQAAPGSAEEYGATRGYKAVLRKNRTGAWVYAVKSTVPPIVLTQLQHTVPQRTIPLDASVYLTGGGNSNRVWVIAGERMSLKSDAKRARALQDLAPKLRFTKQGGAADYLVRADSVVSESKSSVAKLKRANRTDLATRSITVSELLEQLRIHLGGN